MKRIIPVFCILLVSLSGFSFAQSTKSKVILFISEQNIEGPQRAWWASEVDLSATESAIARKLISQGFEVVDPSSLTKTIKQRPAFRIMAISEKESLRLGNLANADYLLLGRAVASAGANVPQSTMRSCFANVTAKLIRVKDARIISYLDASGNSAHMDAITGGREALSSSGDALASKIIEALNKEGGR